jgi:hypothetical protein
VAGGPLAGAIVAGATGAVGIKTNLVPHYILAFIVQPEELFGHVFRVRFWLAKGIFRGVRQCLSRCPFSTG